MVDRCIDLDEVVVRPTMQVTAAGGYDAGGDGGADAERITDGENLVAELEVVGVTPGDRRQRLWRLDLDDGEIRFRIGAEELGRQLRAVVQGEVARFV
jgi:hypothetical protein